MLNTQSLDVAKKRYRQFIGSLSLADVAFKLTPASDTSPYARCFAIFGRKLLLDERWLIQNADALAFAIRRDLDLMKYNRQKLQICLSSDKAYLQLLTFSLSALSVINHIKLDPLEDHILPLVSVDVKGNLEKFGALEGIPQSGNQAMFLAIILCHAGSYFGKDVDGLIAEWISLHLKAINKFGFWGSQTSMSHLQFQNGYHQYEILDYFECENVPWNIAADSVASLTDDQGHFAPYRGGGGCYDYDATFVITGAGKKSIEKYKELLLMTGNSILNEQNGDGGFCESHQVRPLSAKNLYQSVQHVMSARGTAQKERLRRAITLLRPRNSRIHTHWTEYSRGWSESNLWDSWFRMLCLARIDVACHPMNIEKWGFIDHPGIGYHSLLKKLKSSSVIK